MTAKTALTLSLALASAAAPAIAQDLKPTSITINDQTRVGYYWLYLPETQGWWADEGIDMEVINVTQSVQALQQVVAGRADFAQLGAGNIIQANAQENLDAQIAMMNGVFAWKIGVPADGDIESASDFAGKALGVYDIAANGNMFLKPFFENAGISMDDVTLVPVGYGASALNALENGDVAGLYYWPSAFTSYEANGSEFDYLASTDWARYPDYSVMTMGDVVERDPDLVVGTIRGMAKAWLFASTNPECAVKAFWNAYPDAKPVDMSDEAALAQDVSILRAQLSEYDGAMDVFGDNIGAVTPEAMGDLQDLLISSGQLAEAGDTSGMVVSIPGFFDKVNDFDKAAIRASAEACDL